MNGYIEKGPQKRHKRLLSVLLFVCLAFVPCGNLIADTREYRIKAEFLERFTRFIEWPQKSSVQDVAQPFKICVIGKNPYGSYLKDLAAAAKIQKKGIELSDISSIPEIDTCNLLFISNSQSVSLPAILQYTQDKPILTVSDSPGFSEEGVLINFYHSEGYVRFEINPEAVEKSGLRFSSRLLKLGRLVEPKKRGSSNALR